jgi:hypothetical protein
VRQMTKSSKQPMGLRFVGQRGPDGKPVEYIGWAPARDLSAEEVGQIGPEKVEALLASNLYAWASGAAPAAPVAAAVEAPEGEDE